MSDETRQARDAQATEVITAAIRHAPIGMSSHFVARLILTDLRAHGLFDHTCDGLCGTEPDDHHVCGEDGYECGDECVCHGVADDDEDEDEDEVGAA